MLLWLHTMNSPRRIMASSGFTYGLVQGGEAIPLLDLRRNCLTSTNFVKMIGLNRFATRRDLFFAKTGNADPSSRMSEHARRGVCDEAKAIRMLQDRLHQHVFHVNKFFRHPRFPNFVGSPDGVTARGELVEVKCPAKRSFWIPPAHVAQMRWDAWVLDAQASLYVQLIDGEIFVERLERDDSLVLDHLPLAIDFLACVQSVNS